MVDRRDNAPPPDGWCCDTRDCPCFERPDRLRVEDLRLHEGITLGEN